MTPPRRVAITGLGLVCPHGLHAGTVFDRLVRGESAIGPLPGHDMAPAVAARVDFDPSPFFSRLQQVGLDRVSQMAVAAAELAMRDAGHGPLDDPERGAVYLGCGMGGAASIESAYAAHFSGQRAAPLSVLASMCHAPAAHVAMRQHFTGPAMTYSVACASSGIALGEAARAIASGEVDLALAGGSEALLEPGVVGVWQAMKVLAQPDALAPGRSCRPFGLDRSGMVLAEGAAMLVLEPLEQALQRGALPYAELAGHAVRCDATHLSRPDAGGQVRTMRAALRQAGALPGEVGYCNAHGTGTRAGDAVEAQALRTVWGSDLGRLRVGSTKALHGHLLGAAGALEAAITVLAVSRRTLPAHPCPGGADPDCGLPLVGPEGESCDDLRLAISNSFAFGGTNATLVFRRVEA